MYIYIYIYISIYSVTSGSKLIIDMFARGSPRKKQLLGVSAAGIIIIIIMIIN